MLVLVVVLVVAIGLFVLLREDAEREYPEANFAAAIEIAPLDEALTFARTTSGNETRLWAVTAYEDDHLTAIDLTSLFGPNVTDPVDLFNAQGYDALQQRIESARNDATESVAVTDLVAPLNLTDAHVAAGTNFAAHAKESEVEDGPFLFAKLVTPTSPDSTVHAGNALLDYEVELSFVTLSDAPLPEVPEHMGLILSNDFTDRAKLLRHLNPDDVTSGDGFTTGKSAEGYLPVGNLFVIPRDLRRFVKSIVIELAVNGQLRQSAPMTLAIWDIDELFRQIQANENKRWEHLGAQVGLPVHDGVLPARTLILSGTPDGTVFSGISNRTMAAGVLRWAAGGWDQALASQVIERYIDRSEKKQTFLQPGDQVVLRAERMGFAKSAIEE